MQNLSNVPSLSNGVLTSTSGVLSWGAAGGAGDNLGNHTATQALNMNTNLINNVVNPVSG